MNDVNGATQPPMRPANDEIPYAWLLRFITRQSVELKVYI